MSKLVAELFRRFLLALADLAAVNHHVVVAGDAIDPDGTEGKLVEAHRCTPRMFTRSSWKLRRRTRTNSVLRYCCRNADRGLRLPRIRQASAPSRMFSCRRGRRTRSEPLGPPRSREG